MVHNRTATFAIELHKSFEVCLKGVQSLLQQCASRPEGPAAPCMRRAAVRTFEASRASKIMGWRCLGLDQCLLRGWPN